MLTQDNRIRIIAGHGGSGKTEFALNYAIHLRNYDEQVGLVDLDVVNLYFRSRERADILREAGIRLVAGNKGAAPVDQPALSAEINAFIEDPAWQAVLDVGGDPIGARVLGRYAGQLQPRDCDFFLVINVYRPETRTASQVEEMIEGIETLSRLKITGLVNTSHLLKETSVENVLKGYKLAEEVSARRGLPIRYNAAIEPVAARLPPDMEGEILPLNLYVREEWMS